MPTYTCTKCNKTFEGHDPLDFTEIDIKNKVLPICPVTKGGLLSVDEFISMELDPDFEKKLKDMKEAIADHPVIAGNQVKPQLQGQWGKGSVKIAPGGPTQKTLTPEEAVQLAETKRRQALETKAKELVNLINICINTPKYQVPPSSQYGSDRLYADDKKLIATSDVIDAAANLWVLAGNDYRCASEFKNELNFRLRNETNFMKSIVSGQPNKGKHNVHIIHVDFGKQIISTPLFETTIERKIRRGQTINSDWYRQGDLISGKVPYAPNTIR